MIKNYLLPFIVNNPQVLISFHFPSPGYAVLVEKAGHFLEKAGHFRKMPGFFSVGQVLVV
jgi:hypothetical protein